jgi:hypothetical protein
MPGPEADLGTGPDQCFSAVGCRPEEKAKQAPASSFYQGDGS